MDKIVLLVSIGLLTLAVKFHILTQANVKTKIEKGWYDRIWTGSRPKKDNLTEQGLIYRKKSDLFAIFGFIVLAIYVLLRSST